MASSNTEVLRAVYACCCYVPVNRNDVGHACRCTPSVVLRGGPARLLRAWLQGRKRRAFASSHRGGGANARKCCNTIQAGDIAMGGSGCLRPQTHATSTCLQRGAGTVAVSGSQSPTPCLRRTRVDDQRGVEHRVLRETVLYLSTWTAEDPRAPTPVVGAVVSMAVDPQHDAGAGHQRSRIRHEATVNERAGEAGMHAL